MTNRKEKQITLYFSEKDLELFEIVDKERGRKSRSAFILDILEKSLEGDKK